MKFNEPIQILESFKRSKIARSEIKALKGFPNGPRLQFVILPFVVGLLGVLFLHGVWLLVWAAIFLVLFFMAMILDLTIYEARDGDNARKQLTEEDLEKARELIKKHGK